LGYGGEMMVTTRNFWNENHLLVGKTIIYWEKATKFLVRG